MKSTYVGKGEIAHLVAQIQSTSPFLEKLALTIKPLDGVRFEKAEAAVQRATDLIQVMTAFDGWLSHSP